MCRPQELRAENERLRLAGDSAREGLARHEAEVARLRRDNARLAAGAVSAGAGGQAAAACAHALPSSALGGDELSAAPGELVRRNGAPAPPRRSAMPVRRQR